MLIARLVAWCDHVKGEATAVGDWHVVLEWALMLAKLTCSALTSSSPQHMTIVTATQGIERVTINIYLSKPRIPHLLLAHRVWAVCICRSRSGVLSWELEGLTD